MASFVYNEAKRMLGAAELNFSTPADIRLRLVMTNTTCDTQNDAMLDLADFTTIDVMDGTNYVDKALGTDAFATDDTNDRAEYDAADVTWTALGAGTRSMDGCLVYLYVDGTDANDKPIAFIDFSPDVVADGSDFTMTWDAEGIFHIS